MRYLKIIVFVLMLLALVIPSGAEAQETAKDPTTAAEELSLEQFLKEFLIALQANDAEQLQQLITANPETAEQLQQRLIEIRERHRKKYRTIPFFSRDFEEISLK